MAEVPRGLEDILSEIAGRASAIARAAAADAEALAIPHSGDPSAGPDNLNQELCQRASDLAEAARRVSGEARHALDSRASNPSPDTGEGEVTGGLDR